MKRLLGVVILLGLLSGTDGRMLNAQEQEWSRPQYLGDGWFPDITADPTGQLHVVWVSGRASQNETGQTYDLVLYTTSINGACWLSPNDIVARSAEGGAEATRPTIMADTQGQLHLTFRNPTIHYAQSSIQEADHSSAWRTTALGNGYYSALAQDSQGRLHLVYTRNKKTSTCPICYHLYYQRSADNGLTWSEPLDISQLPTGAAKPQLKIDAEDNLFLVWETGEGGAQGQVIDPTTISFARSTNQGETWSMPFRLSAPGQMARQPGLGLDGEGRLVVVWLDTQADLFYYSTSTERGRDWSTPTPIPNVYGGWGIYQARLDHTVMERDNRGDLHLVLVGRAAAGSLDLLHLTWDGNQWSNVETIATFTDEYPEWPEITIANGNQLHVVWFTRPKAYIWSGGFGSQVWHTLRSLDTPGTTSMTLPATRPVFTPTPLPCLPVTPTPTALPANTPLLPLIPGDLENEINLPFIIIKGIVPAGMFLTLAFVVICWWRRQEQRFPTGED